MMRNIRSRWQKAWMTNKWFLLVILLIAGSFYWFQVRPIYLSRGCAVQASADARMLLQTKAEVSKGTKNGAEYQQLIDKNLYLRSDYESFLTKCLLHHNISRPVLPAPVSQAMMSSSSSQARK